MMGRISIAMATLAVMLWMGCASSSAPPAYYGLQAATLQPDAPSQSRLTIGIGPVLLPEYLDRAPIVTRLNPNRLQVNDGHRWAGSLHSEILRVLSINLKQETACRQVVLFPWTSNFKPDIRFRIFVQAFEGRPGHQVVLKATWSMARPPSSQAVLLRDTEVVEKVNGDDFESLTDAMGRALAAMSHEMALALQSSGGQSAQSTKSTKGTDGSKAQD